MPGLRRKFDVFKSSSDIWRGNHSQHAYPVGARVGADGEFIFVLRPETDVCAVDALTTYAQRVRRRDPKLADEIMDQLVRIVKENGYVV